MSGFEKHPILANGEYYITPLEKRIGGGNITRPHEYFEAKQRLLSNIDSIQAEIEKEKEIFILFSLNHIGRSGAIKSANAATDAPNSTVPLIAFNVPRAVLIILFLGFSAADSVSITSKLS